MRIAFDHILLARILFTLTTLGWSRGTVIADFNKTHATNPQWTGHARFHVVWQISSYSGFGLLALPVVLRSTGVATELTRSSSDGRCNFEPSTTMETLGIVFARADRHCELQP